MEIKLTGSFKIFRKHHISADKCQIYIRVGLNQVPNREWIKIFDELLRQESLKYEFDVNCVFRSGYDYVSIDFLFESNTDEVLSRLNKLVLTTNTKFEKAKKLALVK